MRLSTNTRYAIRIIFELHLANAPVPIAALSEQTNISQKTVENIHAILKSNGITEAIIGAHGGILGQQKNRLRRGGRGGWFQADQSGSLGH